MHHVVDVTYWRPRLFRGGLPVRYVGATHEYPGYDRTGTVARLGGDYQIADHRISSRKLAGRKLVNDRDLLLGAINDDPEDHRSVFYLARPISRWVISLKPAVGTPGGSNSAAGTRRSTSRCCGAEVRERLGEPWPVVQDAYLRAYEFRPTRAEPLYTIACRHRVAQR